MSSTLRLRLVFNFTAMSPVLASVTAASPSCKSGAPRVAFHFGNVAKHLLDVADDAVGLLQRTCPAA